MAQFSYKLTDSLKAKKDELKESFIQRFENSPLNYENVYAHLELSWSYITELLHTALGKDVTPLKVPGTDRSITTIIKILPKFGCHDKIVHELCEALLNRPIPYVSENEENFPGELIKFINKHIRVRGLMWVEHNENLFHIFDGQNDSHGDAMNLVVDPFDGDQKFNYQYFDTELIEILLKLSNNSEYLYDAIDWLKSKKTVRIYCTHGIMTVANNLDIRSTYAAV